MHGNLNIKGELCQIYSSSVVLHFARSLYRRSYLKSRDTRRVTRPIMCNMVPINPLFGVPAWNMVDYVIFLSPAFCTLSVQLSSYSHYAPLLMELIKKSRVARNSSNFQNTRVGTLIVATIFLQLIQNRYMFRSFTVLQCSHQPCVQPVASDVEVVGYL